MAGKTLSEEARFHPRSLREWRAWLKKNHASSPGVWLVSFKRHTGKPRLSYDEMVEEALCFGWIDSKQVTLDEDRSMQRFTPRNPKSGWSRTNKERVERLIREGRMAGAGLAMVETAKASGAWSALDAVEDLKVPPDLDRALRANPLARKHFLGFPRSSRKIILTWIAGAKREETRVRRIEETVRLAAENIKANHPRP